MGFAGQGRLPRWRWRVCRSSVARPRVACIWIRLAWLCFRAASPAVCMCALDVVRCPRISIVHACAGWLAACALAPGSLMTPLAATRQRLSLLCKSATSFCSRTDSSAALSVATDDRRPSCLVSSWYSCSRAVFCSPVRCTKLVFLLAGRSALKYQYRYRQSQVPYEV